MPRFAFKFQSILDLKLQIEESLKNELGKSVQKLEQEKEKLSTIEAERDNQIENFNEKSSKGMLVEKLRDHNAYISYLKERIERQKENVNLAQNIVDKNREKLIKAMQEREMLDKLKEKKYKEYLKEQLKLENKANDEIVSFKYAEKPGDENG
ncbi:MAG: flagellar export protein FliJ [Clostridia bacterium]|nr:flagellar export protein FliJ [Clostridia bacterium]